MYTNPYHSSFTAPALLAIALLQACVSGNITPKALSVDTPEKEQPLVRTSVPAHGSQPEEKYGSARQSREQTPTSQHLVDIAPIPQSTTDSGGITTDKTAPPTLSVISQQPQPIVLGGDYSERFKPGATAPHNNLENSSKATEHKNLLGRSMDEFAHGADPKDSQSALPSIEALLKRLQNLDTNDIMAYADCLGAIGQVVSPASAARVQSALDKAYHRLSEARKAAKDLSVLKRTLKVMKALQADLAHYQKILGEEALATSSTCFSVCGCCEEPFTVDFERVDIVVRDYPAMAAAVVPIVLDSHRASLIHSVSKAKFIHDCLMAYPQHIPLLLAIIHKALMNPESYEIALLGRQRIETGTVDVLASFIEENPEYAEEGIRILNNAFCNFYQSVCIHALQACARILHVRPQCSQYVDQGKLYHAFENLEGDLKGPESAMKALAEEVLKQINSCRATFLREAWERYSRASNTNQP